jgi:hypothetical protein
MFKLIYSILAGAVAFLLIVAGVEALSSNIFPIPTRLDPYDTEQMRAHIETLPIGAFLFVLLAWVLGSFAGSFVATRMSNRPMAGLIVGGIGIGSVIGNMLYIPHPIWMWVGGLVGIALAAYLGGSVGVRKADV